MSVSEVIRTFESVETLPVDIDTVIDEIRKYSSFEEIYWFEADIDPHIIRGFIVAWTYPSEWKYTPNVSGVYETKCADIYYSQHDTPDWQRLVACKEALHLLDTANSIVNTPELVQSLIEKIVLPPELQNPVNDGPAANLDRVAELFSVAILLPLAARNLLLPKFQSKALSAADIARLADIPQRYVPLVMSSDWDVIHGLLLAEPTVTE